MSLTILTEFKKEVCDKYEVWFKEQLHSNGDVLHMLEKLHQHSLKGDINLGCFCAPRRCHCDTIKRYLDNLGEEK
jgi:hypothetical protein